MSGKMTTKAANLWDRAARAAFEGYQRVLMAGESRHFCLRWDDLSKNLKAAWAEAAKGALGEVDATLQEQYERTRAAIATATAKETKR